jgi:predicted nucleic acid-binding Zn ribbon protein
MDERKCTYCDKQLINDQQKFCSVTCKTKAWRDVHRPLKVVPENRKCRCCGNPIEGNNVRQSFCSSKCRSDMWRINKQREKVASAGARGCKTCGKDITQMEIKYRYCSPECKVTANNLKRRVVPEDRSCKTCSSPIASDNVQQVYCSAGCKNKANQVKKKMSKPDMFCMFCTDMLPKEARNTKFCCDEHKNRFYLAKAANRPIMVRVDAKTVIETRKYNDVPGVAARWREKKQAEWNSLKSKPKTVEEAVATT